MKERRRRKERERGEGERREREEKGEEKEEGMRGVAKVFFLQFADWLSSNLRHFTQKIIHNYHQSLLFPWKKISKKITRTCTLIPTDEVCSLH